MKIFGREDKTFDSLQDKAYASWLEEIKEHDDVAVRGGVKLAGDYVDYLKAEIVRLKEENELKNTYLKKSSARKDSLLMMQHVTISTDKLDESIDFYREAVGLDIQKDMRGKDPLNIVFMARRANETSIELIENKEAVSGGGGVSIGYGVPDINIYRERLVAMEYEPGPVISPVPGVEFFFVKDPNGVSIQFIKTGK